MEKNKVIDQLTNVVRDLTRRAAAYATSRYRLLTKRYVEAVHLRQLSTLSSEGMVMRWSYATSAANPSVQRMSYH